MTTSNQERWQLLSRLWDQAMEMPEAERAPWLRALRSEDPEMAATLERALADRESEGFASFLEGPSPLAVEGLESATLVGRHIGPYVVDAEAGRGGMGSVWRAHRADGRYEGTVAIKFVHAMWIGKAGEQRFRFEGRVLARLNHPNIARLLDAGVAEGAQPYLVLEYVEGEPIDIYCERKGLDVRARVRLFQGVLHAVAHAHSNLIVHRDIKPGNVFVKSDGTVKLLDFGIAKLIDDDSDAAQLTRASAIALTPQYAAPEQLLGQPVSTATDVYALGLLLYLLLTGEHPVPEGTRSSAALVQAVLTEEPPRASSVAKSTAIRARSLQGDLDNILHKAIKKNPAERYASAAAFADDLQRYLSDEPVQARPDTVYYRVSKFVKRHTVGTALVSIAVVLLSASLLAAVIQARRAERAAVQAVTEQGRADREAAAAIAQRDQALHAMSMAQDATQLSNYLLTETMPQVSPENTRQVLLKAAEATRASTDIPPDRRAIMFGILGDQLEERRDYATAFQLYTESTALAKESKQPGVIGVALCRSGYAEVSLNRAKEGFAKIEQGLASIPADKSFASARIDCYVAKSVSLHLQGLSGLPEAEAARQNLPDVTPPDPLQAGRIAYLLATGYSRAMRVAEAKEAYAAEEKTFGGRDSQQSEYVHYANQGMFFWKIGRPLAARASQERSLDIERKRGDADVGPMALLLKARISRQLGDVSGALTGYEKSLAHARELHDTAAEGAAAPELLSTLIEAGQQARAASMLAPTEQRLHAIFPPAYWVFGSLRMESALLAERAGDMPQAQRLADEAVVMFNENSPPAYEFPVVLVKRAELELRHDRLDQARADAEHALAVYDNTFGKDILSACIGDALMVEGKVLAAEGDAAGSKARFAKAALHYADSLGSENTKTKLAQRMAAPS
jgi:eukaryotic-like serine/threonine-protein kinase